MSSPLSVGSGVRIIVISDRIVTTCNVQLYFMSGGIAALVAENPHTVQGLHMLVYRKSPHTWQNVRSRGGDLNMTVNSRPLHGS